MNDGKKDIKKEDGFSKLSSEKWALPDEGLVFQLVPKKLQSPSVTPKNRLLIENEFIS